jgi:Protein of unknown function (DUF4254)
MGATGWDASETGVRQSSAGGLRRISLNFSGLPTGNELLKAHSTWTADGPQSGAPTPAVSLAWHWVRENHRFNHLLWNEEDLARRTQAQAEEIAANKRAIDRYNQARNDAVERLDECLLLALGLVNPQVAHDDLPQVTVAPGTPLHSETAGSMVDRLSIMALKVQAMHAQTLRSDVDEAHRAQCRTRWARLQEQRADLAGCYDELLAEARAGRRVFKVYRQFKMYNDPQLNPVLVAERARGAG